MIFIGLVLTKWQYQVPYSWQGEIEFLSVASNFCSNNWPVDTKISSALNSLHASGSQWIDKPVWRYGIDEIIILIVGE